MADEKVAYLSALTSYVKAANGSNISQELTEKLSQPISSQMVF
jgi:hypothetical protein